MLIEFTVANFRSFRDPVCLSMESTKLKSEDSAVDEANVAQRGGLKLLKVAGIYGANASGKSNLIVAMLRMRTLVLDSAREGQSSDLLPADPFPLNPRTRAEPTEFECVWLSGETQFRYGFEFTKAEVVREWLYRRPANKAREHRLFTRDGGTYRFHKAFSEGRELKEKTRSNALHLSVCAQFAGPLATEVVAWFRALHVAPGLDSLGAMRNITERMLQDEVSAEAVKNLVRRLDVGIADLAVHTMEPDDDMRSLLSSLDPKVRPYFQAEMLRRIGTTHVVRDDEGKEVERVDFEFRHESDGTQKLIALAGPWIAALRAGEILVIDEFDARLHPHMTRELIRLFQSPETNPLDAQLVFTTHDTNLLDRCLLRRDQYWFIEKSRRCEHSQLYSLAEIHDEDGKGIRSDARFEKDYLQGRYGAVPSLGRLHASAAASVGGAKRSLISVN